MNPDPPPVALEPGSTARRDRQLREILALVVDGQRERAVGLAGEHVAEFVADSAVLALLESWPRGDGSASASHAGQ